MKSETAPLGTLVRLFKKAEDINAGENMGFVRRKGGLNLAPFRAQIRAEERTWNAVLRHFKELCKRLGGEVEEDPDFVACYKSTDAIGELADDVHEFHNFITTWKPAIKKPLELTYGNRLLGGWEEVTHIDYNPKDDEYNLYVHLYSQYGTSPPAEVKGEMLTERKKARAVPVEMKAEAYVEQNPATDEFVGGADVWASVPLRMIRSKVTAPELSNLLKEMLDWAEGLAEKAEDVNIVPVEEEEVW